MEDFSPPMCSVPWNTCLESCPCAVEQEEGETSWRQYFVFVKTFDIFSLSGVQGSEYTIHGYLFFMSTSSWWHGALPLGESGLGVLLENVMMLLQAFTEHLANPKHPFIALCVPGN